MAMRDLCDELVEEILDHIPIKQVIRMKCLSKSWCSSILRYRDSKPRVSSSTLIFQYEIRGYQNNVMFLRAKEKQKEGGLGMEKLLGYLIDGHINFMGSSNGLLLFNQFVNPDKLITYVCNPAAKKWQWDTLPPLFHCKNLHQSIQIGMGLAYDGVPNHPYKVISYTELRADGDLEFHIYSSNNREWRKHIQKIPHPSLLQGKNASYHMALKIGNVHLFWKGMLLCIASQDGNYSHENLLVFYIQNNSLKLNRLPKIDEHRHWGGGFLWESEGCLWYCQRLEDGFCVWKYIDDNFCIEGDNGSDIRKWKLMHTVHIVTLVSQSPQTYGHIQLNSGTFSTNWFKPCAFDESLQVLYILLPTTIISYSFETQRLSKVWTIEHDINLYYFAPRSLCIHLNGTNHPICGDSILSLPEPERQGPPIMI